MDMRLILKLFLNEKIMRGISIICGVFLLLALLLLTRDIITMAVSPKNRPQKAEKKTASTVRHSLQDYSVLSQNNPFGFPGEEIKAITPAPQPSISETDMTLVGTIAGRKEISYAVFADKSGQQEVFKTGEPVFGLGILRKVEKDRVFISSGGKDVEVPLADIIAVKDVKPSAPQHQQVQFGRKTGESSYQVDQRRVQQAIERPDQILTDARFIPNIVDGKQQGFTISEVKPGGIYQSLGLQNGDVLLRINEFNISNPESAIQAFTALRGIDRAQLDIIRGGSKMTLTYQIR